MNPAATVILIIEDDPPMRKFLRTGLSTQGFRVQEAETGQRGIQQARTQKPELIILDLGLPDMDGVDLIHKVRGWSRTPIIVLSARSQESQKIEALDAGADDYLTKPFSLGELLARIRVALRNAIQRDNPSPVTRYNQGRLMVDLGRRMVTVEGQTIHLTPIQYRLLVTLIKNSGKVMTHRQLMKEVWGPSHSESAHYLRIYISQLRHKLEADPAKPSLLLTESGVGYRLIGPDSAPTPEA
jgi:two-component system KDP operon response regulator KdpE